LWQPGQASIEEATTRSTEKARVLGGVGATAGTTVT
jgi:hypothetical protein